VTSQGGSPVNAAAAAAVSALNAGSSRDHAAEVAAEAAAIAVVAEGANEKEAQQIAVAAARAAGGSAKALANVARLAAATSFAVVRLSARLMAVKKQEERELHVDDLNDTRLQKTQQQRLLSGSHDSDVSRLFHAAARDESGLISSSDLKTYLRDVPWALSCTAKKDFHPVGVSDVSESDVREYVDDTGFVDMYCEQLAPLFAGRFLSRDKVEEHLYRERWALSYVASECFDWEDVFRRYDHQGRGGLDQNDFERIYEQTLRPLIDAQNHMAQIAKYVYIPSASSPSGSPGVVLFNLDSSRRSDNLDDDTHRSTNLTAHVWRVAAHADAAAAAAAAGASPAEAAKIAGEAAVSAALAAGDTEEEAFAAAYEASENAKASHHQMARRWKAAAQAAAEAVVDAGGSTDDAARVAGEAAAAVVEEQGGTAMQAAHASSEAVKIHGGSVGAQGAAAGAMVVRGGGPAAAAGAAAKEAVLAGGGSDDEAQSAAGKAGGAAKQMGGASPEQAARAAGMAAIKAGATKEWAAEIAGEVAGSVAVESGSGRREAEKVAVAATKAAGGSLRAQEAAAASLKNHGGKRKSTRWARVRAAGLAAGAAAPPHSLTETYVPDETKEHDSSPFLTPPEQPTEDTESPRLRDDSAGEGNMTLNEIGTPQGAMYMRTRCPPGSWATLMRRQAKNHPSSSPSRPDDQEAGWQGAKSVTESQLLVQGSLDNVPFGIAWVMHKVYENVDPKMRGFATRFELIMRAGECEAEYDYEELGTLVEMLRCITTSNPPPKVLSHDQFFELCCMWYVTGERWRMRFSRG